MYEFCIRMDEDDMIVGYLVKLINGKLKSGINPLYIGNEGKEDNDCSSPDEEHLYAYFTDFNFRVCFDIYNITFVNGYYLTESLVFNYYQCVLKGKDRNTKILASEKGCFEVYSNTSFSSLIFEVNYLYNSLVYVEYCNVTLSSLIFKLKKDKNHIEDSLIRISGGANVSKDICVINDFCLW